MNINIPATMIVVLALSACSTNGSSVINSLNETTDWTGSVCESPIYKDMIGTFQGELAVSIGNRSCRWDSTVTVIGQNNGENCDLSGSINSTVIDQGDQSDSTYACEAGTREVKFVNGLGVGDDLNTLRPLSLGFDFLPVLEERNAAGLTLVHPVTQYENVVVDYDGLRADNGLLRRRQ